MFKQLIKIGLVASTVTLLGTSAPSWAKEWNTTTERAPRTAEFAPVYGKTLPPIGWVQFCERHKRECAGRTTAKSRVRLTDDTWSQLVRVNAHVNRKVEPVTDQELYNVAEHWTYPGAQGDCEDYVLLKRKILMGMGWPRESLLVTVVLDEKREGHAVLTVVTDMGEFVLDNQNPEILPWHATQYTYIKRQAQQHPQLWVALTPGASKRARHIAGKSGD